MTVRWWVVALFVCVSQGTPLQVIFKPVPVTDHCDSYKKAGRHHPGRTGSDYDTYLCAMKGRGYEDILQFHVETVSGPDSGCNVGGCKDKGWHANFQRASEVDILLRMPVGMTLHAASNRLSLMMSLYFKGSGCTATSVKVTPLEGEVVQMGGRWLPLGLGDHAVNVYQGEVAIQVGIGEEAGDLEGSEIRLKIPLSALPFNPDKHCTYEPGSSHVRLILMGEEPKLLRILPTLPPTSEPTPAPTLPPTSAPTSKPTPSPTIHWNWPPIPQKQATHAPILLPPDTSETTSPSNQHEVIPKEGEETEHGVSRSSTVGLAVALVAGLGCAGAGLMVYQRRQSAPQSIELV